jgi:hypothetical protein
MARSEWRANPSFLQVGIAEGPSGSFSLQPQCQGHKAQPQRQPAAGQVPVQTTVTQEEEHTLSAGSISFSADGCDY